MKRLNRLALVLRSQAEILTQILHHHILNTLILFTALLHTTSALPDSNSTKPTLTIPLGSYLAHINIANMYLSDRSIFLKFSTPKLSFEASDTLPDAESCWEQGYDLTTGEESDLACDTTLSLSVPKENAARFLYSVLPPYGNYVFSCIGVLATHENNTTYLHASCLKKEGEGVHVANDRYQSNRLDITNSCQGEIINNDGTLECSGSPVTPRRILTGSYLDSCDLSNSGYNAATGVLHASCNGLVLTLENASNCIGRGKNIGLMPRGRPSANHGLVCQDDPDSEVKVHTASDFLPPGNYLLSCSHAAFYPCMGPVIMRHGVESVRAGLLSARCANEYGNFVEARLVDGDQECRMSDMGYVSNIDGTLTCDPDIKFNENEYPTLGTDLKPHFQCNPSE